MALFKKSVPEREPNFYEERIKSLEQALYFDKLGCFSKFKFDEDFSILSSDFKIMAISVNLENVNNTLSREKGDEALVEIVEIMVRNFNNQVYHIQGEKFNILYLESNNDEYENLSRRMKTEIEDYLDCMDYDISVYIGMAECISDGNVTVSKQEALEIAIKNMYRDKKIKRPKNRNILREEEENERLKKILEEQKTLKEKINVLAFENDLQSEDLWLSAFAQKRELANEEKTLLTKKEEIAKGFKRIEERKLDKIFEEEHKFDNCIFGHEIEAGKYAESEFKKLRDTLWYATYSIEFIGYNDAYRMFTITVYPLEFIKAPATLPILVVVDDQYEYVCETGKNIQMGIGGEMFTINARFTREGKLSVFLNTEKELISRNEEIHEGVCTPLHFGKVFDGKEIFPIKQNIKGCMDCVLVEKKQTEDDIEYIPHVIDGCIEKDNEQYLVMQGDLFLEIVKS